MIVDAEFNEIEEPSNELEFAEDDSLPWLEAEDEEDRGGGLDTGQLVGFVAALLAILFVVPGAVYLFSNYDRGPEIVADGSTIEAPEGPYKERPSQAGGKEFAGTGDVAPGVGQGASTEARLANGAGAGDGDLDIPMPPIEGGGPALGGAGSADAQTDATSEPTRAPPSPAPDVTGVGVQLAAYGSRARAERGWSDLQRKSRTLAGLKHRVVEGQIDIGTVYRLQAVAANRAEAETLCRTLKSQGLDCQVKP